MAADISLLREWIKGLRFGPLEPSDSRYFPLADGGRGAVDSIFSLITLEERPTTQLLSGPRGSGKTTELLRLKRGLEDAGYTAVVVDMLAYVSQSSPIHAVEALLALGVAFGDHLAPDVPDAEGGFASRFRRFLQRVNVTIDIGPASVRASGEGAGVSVPGLSMDIDVKKEVRHSEPFVQLLRTRLAFHLGELYQEVSSFCQELVDQDLARRPESKGVVLIVDSLEKLRDVSSVRDLFVLDSDKLSFPSHHVVYTVPPVLQFTAPGSLPFDGPVRSVPVPHVRDRDGGRFEAGIEQLREVVARRVSWEQLLGDQALLDEVVLASGGHLGDLFRSVAEIVTSAHGRGADLPVGRQLVDDALGEVARGFSSITAENADCLRRVHGQREQVEFGSNEVERLAGLLDTHMLLAHLNGDTWYEVHPLARRTLGLE